MKLPEKPNIPDSKDTIFWLKFQSQIVNQKKSDENTSPVGYEKVVVLSWLWLVNLMCVNPKELHPTSYVSKELDKATLVTASVTTSSQWWNAFTTLRFLLLMLESMGILTFPGSRLANLALIKLGSLATGVAPHQPGSLGFARIGTRGFITLNIVLTFVSGVGSELLLNQPDFSCKLGEDLVQESTFQPFKEEMSVIDQNTTKISQECTTSADLRDINLSKTILDRANLTGADLEQSQSIVKAKTFWTGFNHIRLPDGVTLVLVWYFPFTPLPAKRREKKKREKK